MLSTGISVAHSNDAIARTFQEPSPRLVIASLRFSIVHVPLELDHNPFTGAIEIHNKAVQNVLSPKLEPEDAAVAQQRPGVMLSWRRVVAQLAGARKSLGRAETTKRIHLPERAAQRNDLRNQNPAERSEKKLTLRSPSPGEPAPSVARGRGGQGVRTRLLDKVVRYRFGDNAELMGAWESARNVAGPFQTKNEPESGAGGSEAPKAA